MMLKRTLPLYVLFLCAAGDAPRGFCDDTKCCLLFLDSTTSAEAETRCQDTGGELYDMGLWGGLPSLQLPDTHLWIKIAPNSDATCLDVGSSQVNRTCTDTVDGFLCQYTRTCKSLLTTESEYVNYTNALGFEGLSLYLPGTVAEVRLPDHPPVSKHICADTQWMLGPWSCEVMNGGCEHECKEPHTCSCPLRQTLHPNHFTCTEDPCAKCTHECVEQGGEWACRCRQGFRLGPEGRCVDVDECSEDSTLCSGEGETCENEDGKYKCTCQEDYDPVGGVCVDSSICLVCQHYCDEVQGALACVCRKGFRVHPLNPTKCEEFCSEQDCPATCTSPGQCYCPDGYIQDRRDNETVCTDIDECEEEAMCDHYCYNTFGGYRCECEEGFELLDEHHCVPTEPIQILSQAHPTLASVQPTVLPSYVKTGSIMGITLFALLCAALLFYVLQRMLSKVQFYSFKREMEIFTLQQVSTETYKRLPHDWQFMNECHRL